MDILNRQFGLIIAYLLPGFVALAGIAPLSPIVAEWLHPDQTGSFAAPVYVLLAATALGMVASCFRWLLVDRIHAMTGVVSPLFNARAIEESPGAFNCLIENHYRYYQFYANTLIAVVWAYAVRRSLTPSLFLRLPTDLGVVILCVVLFAGSRDALVKYRSRSSQLNGQVALTGLEGEAMTNGIDHNQGNGDSSKKAMDPKKSAAKPEGKAKPQAPQEGKQVKR
jgi:hypothetical protein